MTNQENNFSEFMKDNNLAINTYRYFSSPADPVTLNSKVNIFSNERRRLTLDDSRYQLYDYNDGRLFLDRAELSQVNSEIFKMQKDGIPELAPDFRPNENVIYNLVKFINGAGISVFGTNQRNYDTWKVINDYSLEDALKKSNDRGEQQLVMSPGSNDKLYLINLNKDRVLARERDTGKFKPTKDFYELRNENGEVILTSVPLGKLAVVLMAFMRGFNSEQVKNKFLWPNISEDLLSDSDLIFKREFRSDMREIKSVADFETVATSPVHEDNEHLVSKYQYRDKYGYEFGLAIPDSEILDVFKHRYNNFPIDSKDAEADLNELLVSIADQLNLSILRAQRRLERISYCSKAIIEDNKISNVLDNMFSNKREYLVEPVFILVDKNTDNKIAQELTLDQLVEFLWMHTINPEEGSEEE